MESNARTVNRTIARMTDLEALMRAGRKGDTVQTSKTLLVLVHKTGAGPRGTDIEVADVENGNRWVLSLAQMYDVLQNREIRWTFGANATVPQDPKIADLARKRELELELVRMQAEFDETYPTAKKRNTKAAKAAAMAIVHLEVEVSNM